MVSESDTGYLCCWEVYTGKAGEPSEHGVTHDTVMRLVEPRFRNQWYRVFMDRYYNSPKLFEALYQENVLACGTVMQSRRGMPRVLRETKLARGETCVRRNGHIHVVALKWKDNGKMADTGKVDRSTGENRRKPDCVINYNKKMGAVDVTDQMSKYYSFANKTMKCWKKMFFYMLNIMMTNAYTLYRKYTDKPLDHYEFRCTVVKHFVTTSSHLKMPAPHQRRPAGEPLGRLQCAGKGHFPDPCPPTARKRRGQRQCVVCSAQGKRTDTTIWCAKCQKGLCHTLLSHLSHKEKLQDCTT